MLTFKVRSFGVKDPEESWDFGDGTRQVAVHSDGNANIHDPNGYAVTTHEFAKPGIYIVRSQNPASISCGLIERAKAIRRSRTCRS